VPADVLNDLSSSSKPRRSYEQFESRQPRESHHIKRMRFDPGVRGATRSRRDAEPFQQPSSSSSTVVQLDNVDSGGPADGAERSPQIGHAFSRPQVDAVDPVRNFVGICIKRLGRATEQENLKAAEAVLADIRAFNSRDPDSKLPVELYESLFTTFLALRDASPIVSIWKDMIDAGHQPTVKTYTVLMRGSNKARDVNALDGFWKRMRADGFKPDHHAWSARIFGLLTSRLKLDIGLGALKEMGQEWLTAARAAQVQSVSSKTSHKSSKPAAEPAASVTSELLAKYEGDVDGKPRPNVHIMNSAISALAMRNDKLIPQILAWGRSFGIEPDLRTYNTLINISMRHGGAAEALGILRRMREKNISADSTTWTILLSAMFEGNTLDNLSPEEVADRILGFLQSIDSLEGSAVDEKSYALIIDRLLKRYESPADAQRVLDHMSKKGMKPNVQIYTILLSFYFDQSPPDFAAIENLWTRMQSENAGYGVTLDSTFFSRVIEQCAQHHAVVGTKMILKFMARMDALGRVPAWKTLEAVARAFVASGEIGQFERIVERAKQDREAPEDARNFGARQFWRFIDSTGIRSSRDRTQAA